MTQEKTLLTADELLALPDDGKRHELVRGELRTMPPAGGEHGWVALNISRLVGNYVAANHLGWVFAAETGFRIFHNPDTVRAPDVAFVAAGRFPDGRPPTQYPDLAPDLIVEVVSPWDTANEVEEKMTDWLEAGVRLAVAVFPRRRFAIAYGPSGAGQRLSADDVLDGGDVLLGFRCRVGDLFEP